MTSADTPASAIVARGTAGWLVAWGLLVWAAVSVVIRLFGHRLLSPETPRVVALFFVAVVPLMGLVTYPIYHRFDIQASRRPAAAVLMALPGLFLDVILLAFAGIVLPNLSSDAVVNFGAILLFGYAVVLLTGFIPWR